MIKAVIFDMNGVIINDERIHQESWRQYCKKHGFQLSEDDFKHYVFGRTEGEVLEHLYGRKFSTKELQADSDERVKKSIEIYKPQIELAPGLKTLLNDLVNQDIPLAVATSSRKRYFNFIMDELDLRRYFKHVVTAEDVSSGKPDPEIYLKAAALLNVDVGDCEAIEDTISGIKAAKAAGMTVTGIASTHSANELTTADRVIDSFKDIDVATLLRR